MDTYTLVGNKYTIKNIFRDLWLWLKKCVQFWEWGEEEQEALLSLQSCTWCSAASASRSPAAPSCRISAKQRWLLGLKDSRTHQEGRREGATDLQLLLLHGDLQVDAAAFISAHRPQLVFVEGKELGPGEDPQTFNRPAKQTAFSLRFAAARSRTGYLLSLFTDVSTDTQLKLAGVGRSFLDIIVRKWEKFTLIRPHFGLTSVVVDLRFGEAFGTEPSGHLFCVWLVGERNLYSRRSLQTELPHRRLTLVGSDGQQ